MELISEVFLVNMCGVIPIPKGAEGALNIVKVGI